MSLAWEEAAATGGLTYEDYLLFPEDGRRHELIGGDHYVTPAPTTVHQTFLARLFSLLYQHVNENKLGEVLFAPVDVVISQRDVVQPDLIFISHNRRQRMKIKNVQGAPDLIVEVISEASRRLDRKLKRSLYDRCDVLEYWLFDPELKIAEIFRRNEENRLVKMLEYEDAGELTTPLLPGLTIDLKLLWPEIDIF